MLIRCTEIICESYIYGRSYIGLNGTNTVRHHVSRSKDT